MYQNNTSLRSHRGSGNLAKLRNRRRRRIRETGSSKRGAAVSAQNRLRQFRQASLVAIAVAGFLIMILNPGEVGYSQAIADQENGFQRSNVEVQPEREIAGEEIGEAAKDEALVTLNNLWKGFYANLPKLIVAVFALLLAWAVSRLTRAILTKSIGGWKSARAIMAVTAISIWLLAIGLSVSVIVGDIRALAGSLGLVGLALSWSLQTPIESFTGWLMNSFRGYYKVGDRIQVGDVFGEVYKIDFLTTTVWEVGGPYRQGFVMAEQPTGRMVTFPNNEILTGMVINLTGDFPFVWDELNVSVANESDIQYAMNTALKVAAELLRDYMRTPARRYEKILKKAGLEAEVSATPQGYFVMEESGTALVIRYLVGASERRKWKSKLTINIMEAFNKEEHKYKIKSVYPRRQVELIDTKKGASK